MTDQPRQPRSAAKQSAGLYLEDLFVGQCFTSGTYTMDEDLIKAFATEFDPQPFHLDGTAALATVFQGLAASGWHTLHVESEVVEITPSRPKPNQAVVKVKSTILNQGGNAVYVFTGKVLVLKRPSNASDGVPLPG
jgi:acyl dehydratase